MNTDTIKIQKLSEGSTETADTEGVSLVKAIALTVVSIIAVTLGTIYGSIL